MSKFRQLVLESFKQQIISEESPEAFESYFQFCEAAYDQLIKTLPMSGFINSMKAIGAYVCLVNIPEYKTSIAFLFQLNDYRSYTSFIGAPSQEVNFIENRFWKKIKKDLNTEYLDNWKFFIYISLGFNEKERDRNYEFWLQYSVAGNMEEDNNIDNVLHFFGNNINNALSMVYNYIVDKKSDTIYHEFGHVYDAAKRQGKFRKKPKNYYNMGASQSPEEYEKHRKAHYAAWYNTWDEMEQIYREIIRRINDHIDEIDISNVRNGRDLMNAILPYMRQTFEIEGVFKHTEPQLKNKLFRKVMDYIQYKQGQQ